MGHFGVIEEQKRLYLATLNSETDGLVSQSVQGAPNDVELTALTMTTILRRKGRALDAMSSCPEFGVCNGWCPHERYLSVRHNINHRTNCCGLRDLINHFRSSLGSDCPPRTTGAG